MALVSSLTRHASLDANWSELNDSALCVLRSSFCEAGWLRTITLPSSAAAIDADFWSPPSPLCANQCMSFVVTAAGDDAIAPAV
eukprot:1883670-Rhodomonas_salina.3